MGGCHASPWLLFEKTCDVLLSGNFSWIEACINEKLPPSTELEEGLRNGVYLAKLAHFISADLVPLKKIYDRDQTRFEVIIFAK